MLVYILIAWLYIADMVMLKTIEKFAKAGPISENLLYKVLHYLAWPFIATYLFLCFYSIDFSSVLVYNGTII